MKSEEELLIFEDLNEGEKIQESFLPSHLAFLPFYIISSIMVLAAGIGIIGIIITIFYRRGHRYTITNQRVIFDFKFISKNISSIPYNKIQDVHLKQTVIDRLFNIGNIRLNTAGSEKMELEIKGILEYKKIKNIIEKMIHKKSHKSKEGDSDNYSDIEKLHSLMKKGIITKKEFEEKKNKLLE
jgi:uncharacterized membrane protein YdbT with pleckstrin-like domain|tara:strand:- start:13 stop:564 length:552 start_codon:yes stop_codon:yes gene_type:complete